MRKAFKFIPHDDAVTHVYDAVSKTIPDQTLGLRDMLLQFAYIGTEKLSEIVNRGFDGDEDSDLLGVDAGSLDYAEIHDRMLSMSRPARPVSAAPAPTQPVEPEDVPADEDAPA